MSLITSRRLQKLYNEVHGNDLEYKTSEFWQVYLQQAFTDGEFYTVCEHPPDNSLRRVDIVVKRYDENEDTLATFCYFELKGRWSELGTLEDQAADAAKRAITTDNLTGVYAGTMVKTRFRTWYMSAGNFKLQPLHGEDSFADKSQYIDADSDFATEMTQLVSLVKLSSPVRQAPTIPSQSHMLGTGYPGAQAADPNVQGSQSPGEEWLGQHQPSATGDYEIGESSQAQPQEQHQEVQVRDASDGTWVEVQSRRSNEFKCTRWPDKKAVYLKTDGWNQVQMQLNDGIRYCWEKVGTSGTVYFTYTLDPKGKQKK